MRNSRPTSLEPFRAVTPGPLQVDIASNARKNKGNSARQITPPPVVKHLQRGCLLDNWTPRAISTDAPSPPARSRAKAREESPPPGWCPNLLAAVGVLEQLQPDDAKYLFTALSATMGLCGTIAPAQ